MYKLVVLIFAFLLLIANPSFGQQEVIVDSIYVTASRIPTLANETGKSVTILSSQEIQNLPITSPDELLRYVAGVNLNMRNAFGVQTDIGIRGSTFSQVVVLLDNVRINGPLTAHFNNNIPISLAEIDRIEIIRGPASAAYGADAVGGIIHIKSKLYTQNLPATPLSIQGQIGYGQHNLSTTDLGLIHKKNKWALSASYKTTQSDGETLLNPNFTEGISSDSLWDNYFDIRTYSLASTYQISSNVRAYARAGYDRRDFSAKYFYTRSNYDESVELTDHKWVQSSVIHTGEQGSNELSIAYTDGNDLFFFNPLFAANNHNTKQFYSSYVHNRSLSNKAELALGGQYIKRSIVSTDRGDHNNSTAGIFGTLGYYLSSKLKTTTSIRYAYDDNFKSQFLPQISLAYLGNTFSLRSSVGKSIRAGDFTERYISSQITSLSPGRNIGNPDLQEETAWSYEIGGEYYPSTNLSISSTLFYRDSNNLIDYTLTNSNTITNTDNLLPDENYFYATNVSSTSLVGLELGIRHQSQVSGKTNVKTSLNYTYLMTTNDSDNVSKYIANHPAHNLNLNLNATIDKLSLSAHAFYITRNGELVEGVDGEIKSQYVVANVKAKYFLSHPSLSFFAEIQNVFNQDYQEILGAPLPGRWGKIGFQFNIGQ